jgi:hypothetical protein
MSVGLRAYEDGYLRSNGEAVRGKLQNPNLNVKVAVSNELPAVWNE